jgi:hypothetical protein
VEVNVISKEEIRWKGKPIVVDAIRLNHHTFVVSGNLIKTAALKNEWEENIQDPVEVIRALRGAPVKIDFLKFWQRVPETDAKFPYYREWRDIAAIPITTFDNWWRKQISPKARNKVRKAFKVGVVVREARLDDELVRGIADVFNDSPVRRGKRFWHYGRSFESVKNGMRADLSNSVFVAAYYKQELIGFVKFIITDRYAMTSLILDKQSHRDKAPMNAMIAKVVEICAEKKIPYFTYTIWRRGDHGHFQKSNGFIKIPVPEYFVPLTLLGRLALFFGLHKGLKGALPEPVIIRLLELRRRWYEFKYGGQIKIQSSTPVEPTTVLRS